ncbi:MAG: hypothetical protein FE78DRAFT_86559 [Acidomyces sp. 'richmondensis']|nr:MAG: hypothetical protein FE78DRAFT_86559 [Acidomyces sp. 'richmondensis']
MSEAAIVSNTPGCPASQEPPDSAPANTGEKFDLSQFPLVYVSATHLNTFELHNLEEELINCGVSITHDVRKAKIILSKVEKKARIAFDLRARGLWTEEVEPDEFHTTKPPLEKKRKLKSNTGEAENAKRCRKEVIAIDGEDSEIRETFEKVENASKREVSVEALPMPLIASLVPTPADIVQVVKLKWFEDSRNAKKLLPIQDYTTYTCRRIEHPKILESADCENMKQTVSTRLARVEKVPTKYIPQGCEILQRARADAQQSSRPLCFQNRRSPHQRSSISQASWAAGHAKGAKYKYLHPTATEDEGISSEIPEPPNWVKAGIKYACQRSTPANPPNEDFIEQLKKIRLTRILNLDEIGVRAYSTSIAAIAAYPHKISNPREILALPGCDAKIANLFIEHSNTGQIQAVLDFENDVDLQVLHLFYKIWGVGATTAREFYFDRGWKDLDDIVEYGWSILSRVQQIGIKYYEDFLDLIPRAEVEEIGRTVHRHAVKVRDEGIQSLIVGGHRRGKLASGDVDIIISHPDESQTLNIINEIVTSLESEGWITHTLLISVNNSHRDQQTLPFKSQGNSRTGNLSFGGGFDTLDKALVVWQDPSWPTRAVDLAKDPKAKNPNMHRRVDIIISPWRTVGCAVLGWSGGTTFQRDLRRFAKNVKGWKFDSSGVRDRTNGEVVDLEGYYGYHGTVGGKGRAKTMEEAEERVFEGFGLTYLKPWERCTE